MPALHPRSAHPKRAKACRVCGGAFFSRSKEAPSRFAARKTCSPDCAASARRLARGRQDQRRRSEITLRPCHCCGQTFESEGRFNILCEACRSVTEAGRYALADY